MAAADVPRDTLRKQRRGGTRGRLVRTRWVSHCGLPTCDGRASKCKACKAAYMRGWRPTHAELDPETRRRLNCRAYTNVYQRRGLWPAGPCEECGTTANVENHHPDYNDPKTYRRLCRRHHRALHRRETDHARPE